MKMKFIYNPFTGNMDAVRSNSDTDARYLKLDQTTPQKVINGSPKFQKGITIKVGEKLILDGGA